MRGTAPNVKLMIHVSKTVFAVVWTQPPSVLGCGQDYEVFGTYRAQPPSVSGAAKVL